jgi:oxygen-dependent protoporphyrinogen oxidase
MAHCAVIGGGIAGLAAAWELRRRGHTVTLFEREAELGGRCRTVLWRNAWRIRGAYAFVSAETNIVEQARALGVYAPELIEDQSERHVFRILRRGIVHDLRSLAAPHIATTSLLSAVEKARLLTALPALFAVGRGDSISLDDRTAIEHFRKASPAFADYVLEPVWGLFCGYSETDFSLAWLAWLMSRYDASSNAWWTYREDGVGRLPRAFQAAFEIDDGVTLRLGTEIASVRNDADGVSLVMRGDGQGSHAQFDAAVIAVPGPVAAELLATPTKEQSLLLNRTHYSRHDVIYVYFRSAAPPPIDRVVLPAAEGYHCASNLEFEQADRETLLVYGETKGDRGGLPEITDGPSILRRFIKDVVKFHPELAAAPVVDAFVQQNDLALPTFKPGYLTALADFRRAVPGPRLALAGDWLLNTSVGSAHLTGRQAAAELDAQLRVVA